MGALPSRQSDAITTTRGTPTSKSPRTECENVAFTSGSYHDCAVKGMSRKYGRSGTIAPATRATGTKGLRNRGRTAAGWDKVNGIESSSNRRRIRTASEENSAPRSCELWLKLTCSLTLSKESERTTLPQVHRIYCSTQDCLLVPKVTARTAHNPPECEPHHRPISVVGEGWFAFRKQGARAVLLPIYAQPRLAAFSIAGTGGQSSVLLPLAVRLSHHRPPCVPGTPHEVGGEVSSRCRT